MWKNGTWPSNVAVEPLSSMDSAGSCDSVISMNSGNSDDSMEHLSPEERACLMYLEATIEALEVQEDSGLSNDEPDVWTKAGKQNQIRVNGFSNLMPESANQEMSLPLPQMSADPITSTTEKETEHHVLNPDSEPQSAPGSAASVKMEISPAVNPSEVQSLSLNGDNEPQNGPSTQSCPAESAEASEMDLSVIPPPLDFMDEADSVLQPEKVEDLLPPAEFFTKSEADVESEQLHSTDSVNKTSQMEDPPVHPPQCPPPVLQTVPPPDYSPPKSPPAVAPKPKKLPSNILLKSQKTPTAGSDGNLRHSVPSGDDRVLMDPQKVRMEALRKLGLLKSYEEDLDLVKPPKPLSKNRMSWAGPSPLVSPAVPVTPPMTPSSAPLSAPPLASAPLQSLSAASRPPPSLDPDILPAPAAFSDFTGPLPSKNELSAVKDVTDAAVPTPPLIPPLSPPVPAKQLTPSKVTDLKSATLDRCSSGLSSYTASHNTTEAEQSPKQLRSSRPRPASLGSGKEFSQAKAEDSQSHHASSKQPDPQRTLPKHGVFQHSRESAKLPRSQGISVMIRPRTENEEDRRGALKKLGLLRE